VGLLDSFERGLERAVNGAFAKTFRSGVQPVEIVAALRREMDTRAQVIGRDRILAPNSYEVQLSRADAERLAGLGSALRQELHTKAQEHGASQGYTFSGPLTISLRTSDDVQAGTLQVTSSAVAGDVVWQAALDIDGRRYPLTRARTVIGRGSDSDIPLADAGTSRRHVEVLWDGPRPRIDERLPPGRPDGLPRSTRRRPDDHDRPHEHRVPRARIAGRSPGSGRSAERHPDHR
jgi:hypothetical protein